MSLVLSLAPVIERIRAEASGFREIGGAAEIGRAMQDLRIWPAAWVLPLAETAEPSPYADPILDQRVRVRFCVLLAARDVAWRQGEALTELGRARSEILRALLPWAHPDAGSAPVHERGSLVSEAAPSGLLVWRDDYVLTHHRRLEDLHP